MRLFLPLFLCLSLSACIDAEVTLDVSDGETMAATADLTLSRQLYDMLGQKGETCPNGTETLGKQNYRCTMVKSAPIDEVIAKVEKRGEADLDLSKAARIERIDDNHLRISFDLSDLTKGRGPKPEDMGGMEDMLRAAMAGHSLSFHVRGYKIASTTGTLSEDGKTASKVIPVTALLEADPDLGTPFVTEVQLKQSCTLWIFCD